MSKVFLLIGGNLGDRYALLKLAKEDVSNKIGKIIKESSTYETAPWGFEAEQDFLNQVIIITTNLTPIKVLRECESIENNLGRVRQKEKNVSRTMDIDILFYNDEIIRIPDLTVPHEKLHLRKFTLEPLVELEPNFIHPLIKRSLTEILKECTDNSGVKKL